MSRALQRLLARPSSLELLRYLVGKPEEFCTTAHKFPIYLRPRSCCRRQLSTAVLVREKSVSGSPDVHKSDPKQHSPIPSRAGEPTPMIQDNGRGRSIRRREPPADSYGPWNEISLKGYDLEYESNLEATGPKLLDDPKHKADHRLWAYLFNYRRRIHGISGVAMFWEAAKRGDFEVPVQGKFSRLYWDEFVKLGLRNHDVLNEVLELSNQILESKGKQWAWLYIRIVYTMLLNGRGKEAIAWHGRLFERHPPAHYNFAQMVSRVIFKGGDVDALKEVYKKSNRRDVYGVVVPSLCSKQDFESALKWHFILTKNGDLPQTSEKAEPLIKFLGIYDEPKAIQVTRSLEAAGVPFSAKASSSLEDKAIISREMINLIHGETHNIQPKAYNDNLGARWFATRWVSLDVAMTGISALGVSEIGPLSLQAIALREKHAGPITRRIDQLKTLDISIGNSIFSRAVEKFARTNNQAFLDCLLESDQHPHELEDSKLQEELLNSFARSQDGLKYQLTLEMRLIANTNPEREMKNIKLRSYAQTGDTSALLASLEKMRMEGTVVTTDTISTILRCVLRPRQVSRRPTTSPTKQADDLKMAIGILKGIMDSGSFVSVNHWLEIIKRLGMLGRRKELEELCLFLASWYGPANARKGDHRYQIPPQVKTSHPLHPLKILFPPSLQGSIIEWGFIQALSVPPQEPDSKGLIHKVKAPAPVTWGIRLVERLREYGVHIERDSVDKAIYDRLVTYYGPGQSSKIYNRRARANNVLSLEEMAAEIDAALGRQTFSIPNIRQVIEERGNVRVQRIMRKQSRARQGSSESA